jgi:hypothetical protein
VGVAEKLVWDEDCKRQVTLAEFAAAPQAAPGHAHAGVVLGGTLIVTNTSVDPDGYIGAVVAEKFARRGEGRRGRPDDPEGDLLMLNAAGRLGFAVSLKADLRREIAAAQNAAGGMRSPATIKARLRQLIAAARKFRGAIY